MIRVNCGGFSRVGDTIMAEPALRALGESRGVRVGLPVSFPAGHERFFQDHPWIVPVPEQWEKPEFVTDAYKALHWADVHNCHHANGFFEQVGMPPPRDLKAPWRYHGSVDPSLAQSAQGWVLVAPFGYSCTSRDSRTGLVVPGQRPNIMPPPEWWQKVLPGLQEIGPVHVFSGSGRIHGRWDDPAYHPLWENPISGVVVHRGLNWLDTLSMMSGARVLVSVNTGIMHLADAVGIPVVYLKKRGYDHIWAPQTTRVHLVQAEWCDVLDPEEAVQAARLVAKP